MTGETYVCAQCGRTCISSWSEEEARAEAVENFGDLLGHDPPVVCDDCYRAMVALLPPADYVREVTMQRNPGVDCTDDRCPFAHWPHTVELVPNTDVRVHYAADPEAMVITLLWIHEDSKPWPDEAERAEIRRKHDEGERVRGRPFGERDEGEAP